MEKVFVARKSVMPKGSHKGRQQSHYNHVGKYTRQRMRTTKNKFVAQEKHLNANPNDLQAVKNIRKAQEELY